MYFVSSGRFGKRNENEHQLVMITLESPEVVRQILRNKHTLNRNLKIFLEVDLTNEQRIKLNAPKNELTKRMITQWLSQSNIEIY